MNKFIINILVFISPVIVCVLFSLFVYLFFDPFKVLYDYDSYYEDYAVGLNRDYVSTKTFIKYNKYKKYNSFIVGNSRSIFYEIEDWEKHLDSNATCFHFDASGQALWALHKKIKYIDKAGNDIENILMVLDFATLSQDKPKTGHLGIIAPPLIDNSNIFDFHKAFLLVFYDIKFFYSYVDYKISGEVKNYMKKYNMLDDRPRTYDVIKNEIRFDYFEELIKQNKYFTPERKSVFYLRDTSVQEYSQRCILGNQKTMLADIASIFRKHNTEIRVVISPLYDQMKLNENDMQYLKQTFGEENVFDFSGINTFTSNYKNYYETSHYRPHVARAITFKF